MTRTLLTLFLVAFFATHAPAYAQGQPTPEQRLGLCTAMNGKIEKQREQAHNAVAYVELERDEYKRMYEEALKKCGDRCAPPAPAKPPAEEKK